MSHHRNILRGAFAALAAIAAGAASAAQPTWVTPGGTALAFAPVYAIPYAVSGRGTAGTVGRVSETVVTVGVNGSGTACQIQVEWRDWNGVLAGVSGPFVVGPEQTLEFTTFPFVTPPQTPAPFTLNVFRSSDIPFEGHAKVRSSCPSGARLRVNAQAVITDPNFGNAEYVHIKVTRVPGNVGD